MITAPIVQLAYFVPDVRAAAARMADTTGAGPFVVVERIELTSCLLRGEPGDFVHTSAYGQWGELMVEFVQQDSDGASPFRDVFAPGERGVHHVATIVDDLRATLDHYARHGHETAALCETAGGTEFAFVDTVATLGHMVELYEPTDALVGFYDRVRSLADGWDGTDPVR